MDSYNKDYIITLSEDDLADLVILKRELNNAHSFHHSKVSKILAERSSLKANYNTFKYEALEYKQKEILKIIHSL